MGSGRKGQHRARENSLCRGGGERKPGSETGLRPQGRAGVTRQGCRGCTERLAPAVISFPAREQWLKNKRSASTFPPRGPHARWLSPGRANGEASPGGPRRAAALLSAALTGASSLPSQALHRPAAWRVPRDEDAAARWNALSALAAPRAQRPGTPQRLTPVAPPRAQGSASDRSSQLPAAWNGCRRCAAAPSPGSADPGPGWGRASPRRVSREAMVPPGGCPQRRAPGPRGLGNPPCPSPSPLPGPVLRLPKGPAGRPALARMHARSHPLAFSLSPATTHLPWERQLLPRLQWSRLSLHRRGEYLSATSTLRLGAGGAGDSPLLGRFTQSLLGGPAERTQNPEKVPHAPFLLYPEY